MPEDQKPIVSLKDVSLSYGNKVILKNLFLDIYPRELVSIVGPSGSGKSTILKIISGLAIPDSGEVIVRAKKMGMAFQYSALFNSMTVWENVALALQETTKLTCKEIEQRVKESLDIVGLKGIEDYYPGELSGGMQKRVSIARALALQPDLLLYDEPSAGLDPVTAEKLENDMVKLRDEIGVTSIIVTHDIDTIESISDRILILDKGHIVWQGNKKTFLTEKSKYPCQFRKRRTDETCEFGK